jgi:hypothetical protein
MKIRSPFLATPGNFHGVNLKSNGWHGFANTLGQAPDRSYDLLGLIASMWHYHARTWHAVEKNHPAN